MAVTLLSIASGNFSTAGSWGLIDATSLNDVITGPTALTASYVASSNFTPGAITIDAIAIHVSSRAAGAAANTLSAKLYDTTAAADVAGTTETINVSDIAESGAGWFVLKFAAPVTLIAGHAYNLQVKLSATTTAVSLYGSGGNWARWLRVSGAAGAAPAAGDTFHIAGEWTAPGAVTSFVITMNNTSTTSFGSLTTGYSEQPAITINRGGSLIYGIAASTAYNLRIKGILQVYAGGVLTLASGTLPTTSTAVLEFDTVGADGDSGLRVMDGGSFTAQDAPRTAGKSIVSCLLNANAATGNTALTVDTDTGWLNGDDIGIACTIRAATQSETGTLNVNATATTVTIGVGISNAHGGVAPIKAEVICLTRRVEVRSISTTLMAFCNFKALATVSCSWMSFRYMGCSTAGRRGVECECTQASGQSFTYCSLRNFDYGGFYLIGAAHTGVVIDSCVFYDCARVSGGVQLYVATTTGTWTIQNCVTVYGGAPVELQDMGGTFRNMRLAGANARGFFLNETPVAANRTTITGVFDNIVIHSSNGPGLQNNQKLAGGTISNLTIWRNASYGIDIAVSMANVVLDTLTMFGNTTYNLFIEAITSNMLVRSLTSSSETSNTTTYGIGFYGDQPLFTIENATFGTATGSFIAHTADVWFGGTLSIMMGLLMRNVTLASGSNYANKDAAFQTNPKSFIARQRIGGVAGVHSTEYPALGTIQIDTTTYHTAAPSEAMVMTAALPTMRLQSSPKRWAVASGGTATAAVYVRKSSLYAGSTPRLMLRANAPAGILADTVLATFGSPASTWAIMTGTTPAVTDDAVLEFFVDGDGAAGQINVDDWSFV